MQTSPHKNAKSGIWRSFVKWLFPAKVEVVRAAEVPVAAKPVPLNPAELRKREWARLTAIIDAGTETTLAVKSIQTSASQRIDAAGYALEGLRAELASALATKAAPTPVPVVVVQPAVVAEAQDTDATVHKLEPSRTPAKDRALAA